MFLFANLVLIGLMKMKISFFISILASLPLKKVNLRLRSVILRDFEIKSMIFYSEVEDTVGRKTP